MATIWISIFVISTLSLFFGGLLGYASHRFKVKTDLLVEHIDAVLPQSQCGQCGYPGCRPYAEAIGNNNEKINKCIPGGEQVMLKLANLLNVQPQPMMKNNKSVKVPVRTLAWINEANCIGCTKCIRVCPVDAIVGTVRAVHTVLSDICTGCNLCITPCPTNCIEVHSVTTASENLEWNLQTVPIQSISVKNHV